MMNAVRLRVNRGFIVARARAKFNLETPSNDTEWELWQGFPTSIFLNLQKSIDWVLVFS